MNKYICVFIVALTTLMTELVLTRVFDVILQPNLAYMVITLALFSFGLAGVYITLKPIQENTDTKVLLSKSCLYYAVCLLLIRPAYNIAPFNFDELTTAPLAQSFYFGVMFLGLCAPFFFAGIIFATLFSAYPKQIRSLYFWDLLGAGIGCVILIPFISPIGPGGLLMCASALLILCAGLFTEKNSLLGASILAALVLIAVPFLSTDYLSFTEHMDKRNVKSAREAGQILDTHWDPISKIDIVRVDDQQGDLLKYHIAYDGGQQSSFYYLFDGDYKKLRDKVEKIDVIEHKIDFWDAGVLASHYLKRDSRAQVLIIGAAGGQETKAALTFGAQHVDGIELVDTVIKLGKGKYAEVSGNVFNNPAVTVEADEGRSFVRSSDKKYDIIQIFSNHTSSSIGAGNGAIATVYLQTVEAYEEYFSHLKDDGILHINHHFYPKMVITAAAAWKKLGHTNFRDHVAVFSRDMAGVGIETLPTLLISMKPWTQEQLDQISFIVNKSPQPTTMVENPLNHAASFLDDEFYEGAVSDATRGKLNYRLNVTTDDRPFFSFMRKVYDRLPEPGPGSNMTKGMADILNRQFRSGIPMDSVHLFVTGFFSIIFSILFIVVPLRLSSAGKENWGAKYYSLAYFSCLGAGFIIIELILIQIFMRLIGFPLYTYSVVIFALLASAGTGSLLSGPLGISPTNRWIWPFAGAIAYGIGSLIMYPVVFNMFLSSGLIIRCAVSFIIIFPLGFFLGIPFPLGIQAIEGQPRGAIAWAWGMNGLFTTVGGLLSIILSVFWGFTAGLLFGFLIYCFALLFFSKLRLTTMTS